MPQRAIHAHHTGRSVTRDEKARVFQQSRAVLNNLHPAENGANCRLFEAAASGAAILCEHREPIADLFDCETEIITYESYADLLVKARRLLADPGFGRTLGAAASHRALSEHTYQHRLRRILTDLV
nr:glycosyltransferase [Nocardioides daedukensis]